MVNKKLSMNHRQQQQQLQSNGVTLKMIKIKNGNSAGTVAANGTGVQKQEDEILEVNLIGVNDNGEPDNVLGDFTEFLDTSQLSDIVMRCSDGRFIECHRLMLAARARNLRHFICGRNFLVTELVFRSCVKYEHLQALVNLIYRGHINGHDHQITSTLWKLFKIFGVRVTAKCYKAMNGQKELAHQLKHDSVENDVDKGAMKFEKIIQEFRSETRRKTRRGRVITPEAGEGAHNEDLEQVKQKRKSERQPGVIVISDDDWSSASCSSSVSSLSSSSSEGEVTENAPPDPSTIVLITKQTNGKPVNAGAPHLTGNPNSVMKMKASNQKLFSVTPQIRIQDIKSVAAPIAAENWESSGSSEGEYVENYNPPSAKKVKTATATNRQQAAELAAASCLEYNQNEMSIVVKSHGINMETPSIQATPTKQNQDHEESEAIICSPQIMFNIKPEPLDEDDEEEDHNHGLGLMEEVDMEHLGIKMEIVEEESFENDMLAIDGYGRRMPPPLLIPLKQKQIRPQMTQHEELDEDYIPNCKLEEIIQNSKPGSSPPANFPPFILRNPRGNQTRTYTTANLWAALMDVKAGESIYRASQQHKVPRKTLRNWMKRCDIKSSYPMPSQLKEAAMKKKQLKYYQ